MVRLVVKVALVVKVPVVEVALVVEIPVVKVTLVVEVPVVEVALVVEVPVVEVALHGGPVEILMILITVMGSEDPVDVAE